MVSVRAMIAAAGKGSRAGLTYPKTLFPVQGKPILVRILEQLKPFDGRPTVIVSPDGKEPIQDCLDEYQLMADLVVQPEPKGMGNAVLRFEQSPAFPDAEHVLLIWGDIPFIQSETVAEMVRVHFEHGNDFTFVTRQVESAYTLVSRNVSGQVIEVTETRELGISLRQAGERDIGLFIFDIKKVLGLLSVDFPGKFGQATGEHGFLYVIGLMIANGMKVEALNIGTELDLVSLNCLKDVDGFL